MIQKTFVGRTTELDKIRNWLKGLPGRLVLLTGPGGIGKTSLLGRIEREYSSRDEFIVEYFDLSEQPMTLLNQALHLVDAIGRENFPQFTQRLTTLEADYIDSAALEAEALNIFVGEVAFYLGAHRKKLLRITDTFEIVLKYSAYGDDWVGGMNEKLKQIPDVFFLIAGRDRLERKNTPGDNHVEERDVLTEITPVLEKTFGRENILSLPLSGFDAVEMEDFFSECDPHHVIPNEMRQKLHFLSGGKPILLSLAVEWLQQNIPLPLLTEKTLEELKELLAEEKQRKSLLDDFEFELVSKVRKLQTPFDVAALYMAHIDRRMDARLLATLLGLDESKANENLREILMFPFIKEFVGVIPKKCALHDEMKELVKKHAWKDLDSSGMEREQLTRKAIDSYYLPRIKEFKKQKQDLLKETQSTLLQDAEARKNDLECWLLEAETLYYYLRLGKEDGYKYFDQLYYDGEMSPVRDQILIDEFKRAGAYDEDKISLRRADELLRRGLREDARRLCSKVLENDCIEDLDRMHAFNTLGQLDFNVSPKSAEHHYREALRLAQNVNDVRTQAVIYNNLGRLFRNVSRLDQSIEYFKMAQDMVRRSGSFELGGIINNNLAWTQRLSGDLDEAETLCSFSIAENRKRGLERPLAYACLTKADIDRDRGDLRDADHYAKQALEIFNRLNDNEGIVQVYRTLANISRSLHNYEQAFKYLDDGIRLAQNGKSFLLLASLYQLRGRTCRHFVEYLEQKMGGNSNEYQPQRKKWFKEALHSLNQSIELARKIENPWEVARSELEITLIMFMQESYDEAVMFEQLEKILVTAVELDNEFLKGYVYENYARIEMKNGRYLEAGHAFGQSAYYIAQRPGVETARAFDRLRNVILDPHLQEEQANTLVKGTYEKILDQADYQKYPKLTALANMCQHMLGLPITTKVA
jgi:tetratricopeptide (TPR) repeat protein